MRRALLSLLIGAALLAGIPAQAFWNSRDSNYNISIASGSSYVGPGDVVSGATAWYGLRGYSAAYATGTGKSVNVRRASDNATQDIVILTSGNLDIASYNTFVGTDATASCTLAGTALACSGATATLHVNDIISGVGITQPCLVTATNGSTTATVVIAGTANSCGTVGVAETVTFQVAGFVTKAYDQTGNGQDASQVTAGNQPQLLPIGLGSIPSFWVNANGQGLFATLAGAVAQAFTYSFVIQRVATFTTNLNFIQGAAVAAGGANATNTFFMYAGSTPTYTASDSVGHAIQNVFNGASSVANADGTEITLSPGASGQGTALTLVEGIRGYSGEAGLWPLGFSSGQRTSIQLNQKAFYGTP